MQADIDSLRQLPLAEKIRVVEALWEDIAVSTEDFPLPQWMRDEVEQRLTQHDSDPSAALTSEEVWRRVGQRRG